MSLARRLISAGFSDLEKGERFLAAPELEGLDQERVFAGLQMVANPDVALAEGPTDGEGSVGVVGRQHDRARPAVVRLGALDG